MQFLEWSVLGLRSARHVLAHPERDVSITLFPMVHLAEPEFFTRVHAEAAVHEAVVIEGIASPVSRRLTRAYRWVAPEKLGLVLQERFSSDKVRIVHADLPSDAFDGLWCAAPFRDRALLETGAAVMGLWLRFTGSRAALGRNLDTTDLPDRDMAMMWSEGRAPLLHALLSARDAALCGAVTELLAEAAPPRSIAVIYGAAHMGALADTLHTAGFRPVKSEWMQVFDA